MKPFIKPLLWAIALTVLLLTIGILEVPRPPKKTNTGHTLVADTTNLLSEKSTLNVK